MNRANTSKRNWGKVKSGGMGGFLNPPTHPEHSQGVYSVYGDTFAMSLSGAADAEWLNDETRSRARRILKAWKRPPIESDEVQDWICNVMGYFKGCYKGEKGWNASDLRIDQQADAVLNQDIHAGVNLIRKYYPEFILTADHVSKAYWGKKQVAA